jgi:hypothetical protein
MVSQKHNELKKQAVQILKKRGFNTSEIFEEYTFNDMRIDIAGIKLNKIILIECGDLQPNRNKLFNKLKTEIEFIHLPYLFQTKRTGKNIDIDDSVHQQWLAYFEEQRKQKPLDYPTLKIFTAKKLLKMIESNRK